jgi:hypothetical protein
MKISFERRIFTATFPERWASSRPSDSVDRASRECSFKEDSAFLHHPARSLAMNLACLICSARITEGGIYVRNSNIPDPGTAQ